LNGFQIGGVPILFSGNISKSKVALELQSWEQKTNEEQKREQFVNQKRMN
jgi:hypothetical protein